jgi:hypothetical protein
MEQHTTLLPNSSASFVKICGGDFVVGAVGGDGSLVVDLISVIADSFDGCIDQCVVYTKQGGTACKAVSYGANITLALSRPRYSSELLLKKSKSRDREYRYYEPGRMRLPTGVELEKRNSPNYNHNTIPK